MTKRGVGTEPVEADLPITPMLDMSFQLLAFFIMTFRPAPTEAQIALRFPPPDVGRENVPEIFLDKPAKFIVRVTANDPGGSIVRMTVREDGSTAQPKEIGPDPSNLLKELKSLTAALKGKPAKLTLEFDDKLLEAYVVQLVDVGIQADFTDISPVPSDVKKR